ncbi:hypothetical protein BU23DRAFT_591586 [Bimuria novae-zelandiae CBS 107.79]|uniref:Actin-like ATPase domain-containing protein n=1 Tax=Bimuria novae-zelandiae CBS 107.79 TaxID=1447943 RepID=A0A6A5UX77_9PLEO|nr:hypothetical protein BU23DRAFT_591586 [Bimuria novae-zelandiae CBS 107.79]
MLAVAGHRLVVGLDYGTTYTGVSFVETSNTKGTEERIQIIQNWPSAHTMIGTKEKVPSEIAYLHDGIKWGGLIPPHVQRNMWTKLELDTPKQGEAEAIRQELAQLTLMGGGNQKKPTEIVADYLSQVKDHLIKNLDDQYGSKLWRTLPMTLVITVPAVWSDAAKHKTLEAVFKAGFNTTYFPHLRRTVTTTEPEAAAIYTIKSLRSTAQDTQLAVSDGFVVCDMGGGTVDLISYRVAELEPTIVEEVTMGTGGQCGGSFVDRGFLKWLEEKVGRDNFGKVAGCRADELSRTSLPPKLGRMVQEFTLTAKSGFSGTEEYFLRLPTPLSGIDDDKRGMSDGEIRVTPADMKKIFDVPLRRTKELLTGQIQQARRSGKAKLKYIFLVGGFAESPWMYKELSTLAQSFGIQAIKPPYSWSAIVRGAAAKGLEGDGSAAIRSRICRRHYGTNCSVIFQAGEHLESDAFICSFSGLKRAHNQMDWIIKKGGELKTSDQDHGKVTMSYMDWVGSSKILTISLLASDSDNAPTSSYDPNVYTIAQMVVDLNPVPEKKWCKAISPSGRRYRVLDFTVEISIQSALEYSLSVNGTKYGSVTANYA